MEIGERVYYRRLELGMSQEELAKKVGYNTASCRSSIQKIEKGINKIPSNKIKLFADALYFTEDELMGWSIGSSIKDLEYQIKELKLEIESTQDEDLRDDLESTLAVLEESYEDLSIANYLNGIAEQNKKPAPKGEPKEENLEEVFMQLASQMSQQQLLELSKKLIDLASKK